MRVTRKPFENRQDGLNLCLAEVKSRLTGRAFEAIRYSNLNTFESLKQAIIREFLSPITVTDLSNELHTARQGPYESIFDFTIRLMILATEYKKGVKKEFRDANVPDPFFNQEFLNGISNPTIKCQLFLSQEGDFEKLTENAHQLECHVNTWKPTSR